MVLIMTGYRSKIHSPLEAVPDKYRTDVVSPLEASPIKYRSREHSAGELIYTPPNIISLYCWFKFNEGAGLTIIDYSPIAINGVLQLIMPTDDPTIKFWSTPGFGHNDTAIPTTWAKSYGRPVIPTRYLSMVGFIKPLGPFWISGAAMWHGVGGSSNWLKLYWRPNPVINYWTVGCGITDPNNTISITPVIYGTWVFAYVLSDVVDNFTKLYLRFSGEPLTLILSKAHYTIWEGPQSAVAAFGGDNMNTTMDGGDMLWWGGATDTGVVTIAQVNEVYEALKGRYGMT